MKAPKCRVCGVSEWRHVCGGGLPVERVTEIVTEKATKPRNEKATKRATKRRKGGRPLVGDRPMTSTERSRLRRQREQVK
jgi:hypothetical protein